jgi:hypothetical protein
VFPRTVGNQPPTGHKVSQHGKPQLPYSLLQETQISESNLVMFIITCLVSLISQGKLQFQDGCLTVILEMY